MNELNFWPQDYEDAYRAAGPDEIHWQAGVVLFERNKLMDGLMQFYHDDWQRTRYNDQNNMTIAVKRFSPDFKLLDKKWNLGLVNSPDHYIQTLADAIKHDVRIIHFAGDNKDRMPKFFEDFRLTPKGTRL